MKYPAFAALGLILVLPLNGLAADKQKPPVIPPQPIIRPDPPKTVTTGTYTDADGTAHPWLINDAHTLVWDSTPYLPVGGCFTPHFWAEGQTDDAWKADRTALETLKAQGVHDLYLYAGDKGLTHVPPNAVQKVLDYLDANGFHYGLEIADFPKDPLIGYVIKPSIYRNASPSTTDAMRFTHVTGLVDGLYLMASGHDSSISIDELGDAQTSGSDTALVMPKTHLSGDVLLLYPERVFQAGTPESHLPDLWQGYDEYRDRLISFFSHVHLGAGFRFFLDPLTDQIGLDGEVSNLVPTTQGFRLDFQAWLDKKYSHNLNDLNQAWGIKDRNLPDFTIAARCFPLWFQGRGVPALYDPNHAPADPKKPIDDDSNLPGVYTILNTTHGTDNGFWDDLAAFRVDSTRDYMNAIADVLKKAVANVPVVYKWSQQSPLFTNKDITGGYDGLGMEAYGHGEDLSRGSGAYTYAQAEETPKTTWVIVSGTQEQSPTEDKAQPGYTSKATLFNDWDYLKDVGARGFFTEALQKLPADKYSKVNLVTLPDQEGWLGDYALTLQHDATELASSKLHVLWYPLGMIGADTEVRRLADGTWWLPSYRSGGPLQMGASIQGYQLNATDGGFPTFVIWSPQNAVAEADFLLPKNSAPAAETTRGIALSLKDKKDVWAIPVGNDPILVGRIPELPVPTNAVDSMEQRASDLIKYAQSEKIPTQTFENQLFYVKNSIKTDPDAVSVRYGLLEPLVAHLTDALRPYAWIEGEQASVYTFDSLTPDPGASNGAYLSLDTERDPPSATDADPDGGFYATYKFTLNSPGQYTLWMAGSPLGTTQTSPFTYSFDNGPANEVREALSSGGGYAGRFVWSQLGAATLAGGPHTLRIMVTGRRTLDDHFTLAIDAFCLSRVPFVPNGTVKPPVDTTIPPDILAEDDKDKKKNSRH